MEQMSLFEKVPDPRSPEAITWNLWCGCTKVSYGCKFCYLHRRFESVGKDPTVVRKTKNYNLPVRRLRSGPYKDFYKVPAGSLIYTCLAREHLLLHPSDS